MSAKETNLLIRVSPKTESDDEALSIVASMLKEELLDTNIDSVKFNYSESPPGAKAGEIIDWGTLIVSFIASGGVLTTIIAVIQNWLSRNNQHKLLLEIDGNKLEITGISTEEQNRLVNIWLSRCSGIQISHDK